MAQCLRLVQLYLYIEGGIPSLANQPTVYCTQKNTYSIADFALIARLDKMDEHMEWMEHVVAIKNLQVSPSTIF